MLKVNANSWHYKLSFKSWTCELFDSSMWKRTQENLCPYMRHLTKVLLMLFVFGAWLAALPYNIHEIVTTGHLYFLSEDPNIPSILFGLWYVICSLFNILVCVGVLVLGGIGGVYYILEKYEDYRKRNYPRKSVDSNVSLTLRQLIVAWFRSHHDKVCPALEIVDE